MKKILTLISFSFFVLSSSFLHAKTEKELVAEYDALVASGVAWWNATTQVVQANHADVATVFNSWKDTDIAKWTPADAPYKNFTQAEKLYVGSLNRIMGCYLKLNPTANAKAPLRVALLRNSNRVLNVLEVDNPTLYDDLKAKGFVVDGVKLPMWVIVNLAKTKGDKAYILSLSVEQGSGAGASYFDIVFNELLEMDDLDAAKKRCREIENFFIKRKQFTSKFYEQAQAVNKVLTARLVDQKISGK